MAKPKKKQKAKIIIKIKNNQKKVAINKGLLRYLAEKTLRSNGIQQAELGILLVGKKGIRALNRKFRNVDRATDVLAFGMQNEKAYLLPLQLIGDIAICPEIARKASALYQTTILYEIGLYLVHGILHLLGFIDSSAQARRKMEREQRRILEVALRKGYADAKAKYN